MPRNDPRLTTSDDHFRVAENQSGVLVTENRGGSSGSLWLIGCGAGALRDNLTSLLIQCARLRNSVNARQYLRIGFKQNLEAFLLAKDGHKNFLLNLTF